MKLEFLIPDATVDIDSNVKVIKCNKALDASSIKFISKNFDKIYELISRNGGGITYYTGF